MTSPRKALAIVYVLIAITLGILVLAGAALVARAEPQPSFDRHLAERLVRAVEAQAAATRDLARAAERCKR